MNKRGSVFVLALVLALLLCAMAPAAFADDACICASAREQDPACVCGCNGSPAEMRENALEAFLTYAMAAEAEQNPNARAMLYREAEKLWDSYMEIVYNTLDAEPAAAETVGIIGGADGPTVLYVATEEPAPAGQPLAEAAPVEEQKPTEDEALENFLMCLFSARDEQDPDAKRELSAKARTLLDNYLELASAPKAQSTAAEANPDPYLDQITDSLVDTLVDSFVDSIPMPAPAVVTETPVPEAPAAATDEWKPLREKILQDYLFCVAAAEAEADPVVREALAYYADALWSDYVQLLPVAAEPQAEPDPYLDTPDERDVYLDELTQSLTDVLVDAFYDGLAVPAAVPAQEPAPAFYMTEEEQLKALREEILQNFLSCLTAAEAESDPAARQEILDWADLLWEEYVRLLPVPAMAQSQPDPVQATQRDAYLDEVTESLTDVLVDAFYDGLAAPMMGTVGLPNPWTETDFLDEATGVSGVDTALPKEEGMPQNMSLLWYRAVPGTLEVDYYNGEEDLMIRASTEDDGYNLSGDYNTYSKAWTVTIDGVRVDCLGDGERVNVATFRNGDMAYAITMACGREGEGLTMDELAALVRSLRPAAPTDAAPAADDAAAKTDDATETDGAKQAELRPDPMRRKAPKQHRIK